MAIVLGKKEEVYGFQTLFRELGYYISRLEHYEKSLKFFDEALKKTPNDKRALIGRSRARAKACQYEGAIEDVNKALRLEPDDLVVLADKALNTYLSCEFEEGLVQNMRLVPIRQKPDNFTMGVMHCTNAIENCVGERTGRPLRDHFKIIRKLAWKKNYEAQKPYEPTPKILKKKKRDKVIKTSLHEPVQPIKTKKTEKAKCEGVKDNCLNIKDSLHSHKSEVNPVPPLQKPFLFKPLQNYTSNIENFMAEKYLDSMYLDKIFLKKLQTEPGAMCPNQKGSAKIKQLSKIGYKTVSYKQELLRTRRPFYYIKYQEARSSGTLKSRQQEELTIQQNTTKKEADVLLAKLEDAHRDKKLRALLDIAEKLRHYCDNKPKRLLPDKDSYLKEIYVTVRKGYYELNRLNKQQYVWDQEKRIHMALGLPISRVPSSDSVVNQFQNLFVDYKKQINTFEKRLKNAAAGDEICWCYHELARFHLEIKRWELARVYSRKCIQEGRNSKKIQWVINASMLLARADIQQHNKNDAKNEILSAVKVAQEMEDKGLEEYLTRCLEVIEKIEFDDIFGPKVLEQREKKIVAMMTCAKMKDEVSHLFRMMSAMPASRRMTIMPGVRLEDMQKNSKLSRKASIMPGAKAEKEDVKVSVVLGPKKSLKDNLKKTDSRGVGFMELIQFHV